MIQPRDGVDLPGRWRHAARPHDEETLCGAPVEGRNWFEHLLVQERNPVLRCRDRGVTFDRVASGLRDPSRAP